MFVCLYLCVCVFVCVFVLVLCVCVCLLIKASLLFRKLYVASPVLLFVSADEQLNLYYFPHKSIVSRKETKIIRRRDNNFAKLTLHSLEKSVDGDMLFQIRPGSISNLIIFWTLLTMLVCEMKLTTINVFLVLEMPFFIIYIWEFFKSQIDQYRRSSEVP